MDIADPAEEIRGLKTTLRSNQKIIAEMQEEISRATAALEEKDDRIQALAQAKEQALAAATAAEQMLQAHTSRAAPSQVFAIQSLEAELKAKGAELARIKEERDSAERLLKARDATLASATKKAEGAKSTQSTLVDLENKNRELKAQSAQQQEENRTLAKMLRAKSQLVEKLQARTAQAEAAISRSDQADRITEMAKTLKDLEEEKKMLERDLARTSAVAARVTAIGDREDGMVPVKQWMEERRYLQGQLKRLQEKLAIAEKNAKVDDLVKVKLRQRLDVLEQSMRPKRRMSVSAFPPRSASSLSATTPGLDLDTSDADSGMRGGDGARGDISHASSAGGSMADDVVPAVMFETLQKEVLALRKKWANTGGLLTEKDETIELLTRKADLLAYSREADARKAKREVASLAKELSALRIELVSREDEYKERDDALRKEIFKYKQKVFALQNMLNPNH
eukprot:jgi/Mesvir1/12271/Mv00481-RA.1